MTNTSAKNVFATLALTVLFALCVGAFANIALADDNGGYGGFGYPDYGSADLYPTDYGSADLYPADYGSADLYPTDYGSADLYPTDYGSADLYPVDYGSVDSYPTSYDTYATSLYSYTPASYAYATPYNPTYYSTPSYGYSTTPTYSYTSGGAYPVYTSAPSRPTTVGGGSNTNVSNYNACQGNSCNTSVTNNKYVDNSINGSFNNYNSGNTTISSSGNTSVTTLKTIDYPTYPVQYTYQQPYFYNNNYNYGNTYPTCTIVATPSSVAAGQAVTLYWSSSNAWTAYLFGGSVNTSGSTTVYPTQTTTYQLTVYSNQGLVGHCQTTAYIGSNYIYVPPVTPYVSLTQIPYTGFDFGTIGNSIYWMSLLAFAIAASYLALYYRGGFGSVIGAMVAPYKRTRASAVIPTPAIFAKESASATRATARMGSLANLPVRETVAASAPHSAIKDSMQVVRSSDGAAPRIVITRS